MENRIMKVLVFIFILVLGLVVFVVFSHFRPLLPESFDLIGRVILATILVMSGYLSRKSVRFKWLSPVLLAYFIALTAITVDFYSPSQDWILSLLKIDLMTPAGIAIDKLDSSLIIIVLIIGFTLINREKLTSIYLNLHNLKQSVRIGLIAFAIALGASVFLARMFGARNLDYGKILVWSPWILIFILGNAFNEELLFRGLFLRKIEPLLGKLGTNIVLAIPFVLHHSGVTYTQDTLLFLAYLLPLSLAWGSITQKTDSLWASVLFHAGMDIPVVLVIFTSL